MDASLYTAINGLAGHVPAIDRLFALVCDYGAYIMVAFLVALWFRPGPRADRDRWQWGTILGFLGAGIALGANLLISHLWFRPRPFLSLPHLLLTPHAADASFPSDHASGGFAIAVAVVLVSRRLGIGALLFAALLAFARVYAGLHYPTDVLTGAVIGTTVTLVLSLTRPYLAVILEPPLRLARRIHLA